MNSLDPFSETIVTLRGRLARGEISAEQLTALFLERIEQLDPLINAFLALNPHAIAQARKIPASDPRPLAGIPISIKDLIQTRDMPTTAGSRVQAAELEKRRDALVVRRLRRAGAIILGKTNLHEFAFGISNENEHFGPVRNPWNPNHISGGSSGGSAASVAARLAMASIGTDTRGSVRIPSACCGVSGHKPTLGAVPLAGVFPLCPSLDHVGPLAASAEDLKLIMRVIARGRPPRTSRADHPPPRIGLASYYFERTDAEVRAAVLAAVEAFRDRGFQIVELDLPDMGAAIQASDVISLAEAVTVHDSLLRTQPERYGPRVLKRLNGGYSLTAVDLVRATRTREALVQRFKRLFRRIDCLLAPALPVPAFPIGSETVTVEFVEEPVVPCFVRLMAAQNMAGLPALCLPCGFTRGGLPIGMQLIGKRGDDEALLDLGVDFQSWTNWHRRIPPLCRGASPYSDGSKTPPQAHANS